MTSIAEQGKTNQQAKTEKYRWPRGSSIITSLVSSKLPWQETQIRCRLAVTEIYFSAESKYDFLLRDIFLLTASAAITRDG